MKVLQNKYLILVSRILVAVVFIIAGAEKISDPSGFAQSIENYRILPNWLVNLSAIALPWIEVTAGILILFGINISENSAIISALLAVFIVAIIAAIFRGLDIDCGCFGTNDGAKVGLQKIIENTLLLLISINLIINNRNELVLPREN